MSSKESIGLNELYAGAMAYPIQPGAVLFSTNMQEYLVCSTDEGVVLCNMATGLNFSPTLGITNPNKALNRAEVKLLVNGKLDLFKLVASPNQYIPLEECVRPVTTTGLQSGDLVRNYITDEQFLVATGAIYGRHEVEHRWFLVNAENGKLVEGKDMTEACYVDAHGEVLLKSEAYQLLKPISNTASSSQSVVLDEWDVERPSTGDLE